MKDLPIILLLLITSQAQAYMNEYKCDTEAQKTDVYNAVVKCLEDHTKDEKAKGHCLATAYQDHCVFNVRALRK